MKSEKTLSIKRKKLFSQNPGLSSETQSTTSRPIYTTKIKLDDVVKIATASFDYGKVDSEGKSVHSFDGTRTFEGWAKPELPEDFGVLLIVGPSGSGKSLLLKQFGIEENPSWDADRAVISHFGEDSDVAVAKMSAVGLNSVPSFASPYHVLSNGEKFRADLARRIKTGAVIDEFTSVVDRTVAKAASTALRRYIDKEEIKNVVFASCHYDILEWLRPDYWFDTTDGTLHSGRGLQRPEIKVRLYQGERSSWPLFKNFHYYNTGRLPSSCRSYVATAQLDKDGVEELVGFVASRPLPSGSLTKAYIACRTVILPDFQGLGLGPRLSDAVAEIHIAEGKRYFSKTTSARLGGWRDRQNSGWKPTSKYDPRKGPKGRFNRRSRTKDTQINEFGGTRRGGYFSHEFIGK